MNFAIERGQRPETGFAEREQSQDAKGGLKVNFAIERGQRPETGFAEHKQSQDAKGGLKLKVKNLDAQDGAESEQDGQMPPKTGFLSRSQRGPQGPWLSEQEL